MWVNRSWTQTEIPWHLWISIKLALQRMNLFLNMAISGKSTALVIQSKCQGGSLPPLLLLRWYREHVKKNERRPHLYHLSCVLYINFRANAACRQMRVGSGRFIRLHLQQRHKTNEHVADITSESWKQNKSQKERSDRKWTEKGRAEIEDGSYHCSGGTLERWENPGKRPQPWN